MSDSSPDELRLRATEAQMRRALGLQEQPSLAPERESPPHHSIGGVHPHRRHFVRDGEVPVAIVHHDDGAGTNKLDAARQALREQIATREQAERLLEEARATIQTLETKLAHERIAKEEAVRQIEDERQAVERQLEEERAARHQVEQERDEAIAARQEAQERLREVMAVQEAQKPATESPRSGKTGGSDRRLERNAPEVPDSVPAKDTATVKPRGRPPKVRQPESEFVEWWVPGWKERLR